MLVRYLAVIGLVLLTACSRDSADTNTPATESAAKPQIADIVFTNGRIYTVNPAQPWAEAVAIKDGKFVAVGSTNTIAALADNTTEVVDLDGAFAMPGIGDPHIHTGLLMPKRAFCALPGTFYEPSEEQILEELRKCIAEYPQDRSWFVAQGYSTPSMSQATLTRQVLDDLLPDRPAWIEDETGHNAWFNTKAMEAAGVDASFEDTPEEFFSRTAQGDLAGVAFEGAMNPFLDALPPFDVEIQKIGFRKLLDEALSEGVTMIGEAYTFEEDLQAWQELKQEGLDQHVVLFLKGNLGTAELTPRAELQKWWSSYDLPGYPAVKLGMGGAMESHSEMLVDGYAETNGDSHTTLLPGADHDAPTGSNARPIIPAEAFAQYLGELDDAGFQVMVHAIGDGTVRATLDGFESVIKNRGGNPLRHHIDHCSLIHPDDFQRFSELDTSCTIWPPLNAPVSYNTEAIKPVLKPETWARIYPNRAAWDAGVRLVNHSDAPAAVMWPWWGMEASITRGFPGKPEIEKMGPDQALTLEELIVAYTINVAWVLRMDDVTGSIEPGKFADMIVLSQNLFEVPATEIHKTEVMKTLFKGRIVYSRR